MTTGQITGYKAFLTIADVNDATIRKALYHTLAINKPLICLSGSVTYNLPVVLILRQLIEIVDHTNQRLL